MADETDWWPKLGLGSCWAGWGESGKDPAKKRPLGFSPPKPVIVMPQRRNGVAVRPKGRRSG